MASIFSQQETFRAVFEDSLAWTRRRSPRCRSTSCHILLPSRFVSSDRLAPFAEREFGSLPKGHQHVTAICSWLCENIDYTRGSSDEETTADESLLKRAGVCRDLAYLGIAFRRALNIPAPS